MLPHSVLIDEKTIEARVGELAKLIATDLPSRQPILLGLLTGSFVFLADLVRHLSHHGIEPQVEFIKVSHYGGTSEASGSVSFLKEELPHITDEVVVVVDDIFDSGFSLLAVNEHLKQQKPAWVRFCTLLDKPNRHQVALRADYVGFEIPDVWIIGYGLDLGGEGRALPYLAAVEREGQEGHK
ncbi:hypoxanthine phosphoribosyltransferase [Candidatus Nitrospira neomarina]|uniref:Hypoxanthine phosphoribosyltransferase n=1 Tax=Candidatus Nitrospira neomarina TaxID=3020899 RepID=A0AA96JVE2_9BACT|nr:hypoxanthine phosphoribosyltransferase [Candidatus Nitrospira neomarina]WNM60915.1 hypoxanthine phosphoribosyltransferase [Candidatus Nitrospira neomarina]